MDGFSPAFAGYFKYFGDIEIRFAGRRRPKQISFISLGYVKDPRSTSENTATDVMPISRQARITRTAISPRFAMRTLENIAETMIVEQLLAASHRLRTDRRPAKMWRMKGKPLPRRAPPAGGALMRVAYFDFGWSSTIPPLVFFEASSAFFLRAAMALSLHSLAVFTYSARVSASSQVMSLALRR